MKWSFPTQQYAQKQDANDLHIDMKIGTKQMNIHAQKS